MVMEENKEITANHINQAEFIEYQLCASMVF